MSGLSLLAWSYSLPAPAKRYALAQTLEAPTERELVLLSATGKPFARRGGCIDKPVLIGEVPQHFIGALLAMEDRRFYSHIGIDPTGILRAAVSNYRAGRIVQGGSTITQQLAKISYLSGAKTFARKLEELVIVFRLELGLTKDQILERYLSRAYFGEGCFGLRAAARHYFNRPVSKLTLAESAYLVALLRSPSRLGQDATALRERERLVLRTMVEDGRLDGAAAAQIKPASPRQDTASRLGAYYADWIADTVKLPGNRDMSAIGVRTSFDPTLQAMADRAVANVLRRYGPGRKASQAALVAMRPDGRVVAIVGGVDHGRSQFNRATQALRQPGSSFKAFVYLAAVRAGARPDMFVSDEPITVGDWSPENYSHQYRGIVSLRQAFYSSINTVAVRLSEAVGRTEVVTAARDLGIGTPLSPGPSIALGTSEVTLLDLTAAYAAFAADAYPVKPWSVYALDGKPVGRGGVPQDAGRWRLTAGDTMREFLLVTVQQGTGRAARLSIPVFGKTGTSQNYRDAWFIGFAGNLVVGVWVGNDDNSPMNRVTGGNLPALIWREFMQQAQRSDKSFRLTVPSRITSFQALPPKRADRSQTAEMLDSVLMHARASADTYPGAYYGHPMMFGQRRYRDRYGEPYPAEPHYGYRPYRPRPARRFIYDWYWR